MSDKITANEVAEALKGKITIENGVGTFDRDEVVKTSFDLFNTTEKDVKRAYDAVATITNGITKAFGEEAIEYMANNGEHSVVTMKGKIAHEKFNLTSHREQQIRNPTTNELTAHPGGISQRRTLTNGGSEFDSIKEHMRSVGGARLGGKK